MSVLDENQWSDSRAGRFTPRKGPLYFLSGKLSAPQRLSGHFGEEKFLLLLPAIDSRDVYRQLLWRKMVLRK
jgi:hypothetical protein